MKKKIFFIFFTVLILICGFILLNMPTTIRQGINYEVRTLEIPLYLKILNFYNRHFNYKWLVNRIVKGKTTDEDKAMAIFRWVTENIRKQPEGLPVVDDHVWYIIVRGYGEGDQPSDVFTTLCNYASLDAFFYRLSNIGNTRRITVSLVKIANQWHIFDPRTGTYFVNKQDSFATVEDISEGNWTAESVVPASSDLKDYYKIYFKELPMINYEESARYSRANIQSPLNRLIYRLKKER